MGIAASGQFGTVTGRNRAGNGYETAFFARTKRFIERKFANIQELRSQIIVFGNATNQFF